LADHHVDVDDVEQLGAVLDAFEATLDDTATELDVAYLVTMRRLRAMLAGEAIDPAEVSRTAHTLVECGRTAHDNISVVRGLLVMATCAGTLGLWRDAGAHCEEVIAIGSPAWARAAHGIQGGALYYGEGTFRAHRDFVRSQ